MVHSVRAPASLVICSSVATEHTETATDHAETATQRHRCRPGPPM